MWCLVACLATPPGSLLLPDAEREQPQLSSLLKTWQRAQPAESTPASRRNHLREEKSCKELVHKVIEASVWQGPGALNVLSGRAGSARIKARVARCVDQFAEAAAASMQLQLRGLVAPGEACLVTALSGHPDKRRPDAGRDHLGHQVFMSSLLRQHPDFDLPVIVFSHDTNATDATTPTQLQTQARAAYSRTIFVEPSTPVFTIARKYYRFGNGRLATSKSPLWKQGFYYARLQLFLLSMCSSVVAVDTSESLVRRPFLDAVLAAVRSGSGVGGGGGSGGSAAPADQPNNDNAPLPLAPFAECQQSSAFAAPPLCGTSTEGPRPYFNAGIFAVGGACLNRPTFARLITTALLPPRPVGWNRRKRLNWADDQDVLNSVFSEPRWRKLPENLTADKRVLRHPRCAAMGAPAVLHFVGTKPWAPLYERAVPSERDPKVVAVELAWWHEYLRDKTVVVGAGPSLKRPIGAWIEMFGTIVRVNDFATDDAWLTGVRTTHAFVHTATRATPALRSTLRGLRRSAIHVAAFGDNASVVQARFRRPGGLGLDLATQCTLLDPWYHRGLNRQLGMADPERTRRHAMLGTVALEWSLRRLVGPAADDEDRRLGDLNGPEDETAADDELADDDDATAGPVFIVGFDMTLHPERQYRHYGGHPAGAGQTSRASLKKFHEPRADSRYVRSLVARGLVRELVPDVLGAGKVNLRWSNNMTRRRVVHHFVMNMSKAMLSAHGHI